MLAQKQNQLLYYKFLKAQRITYARAKCIRFTKYSLSIVLIIIAPLIFIYSPESISKIGIVGAIWALVSFLIGYIEKWLIRRAATIQEIFDTELFELEWNDIFYGLKVIPLEYINGITDKFSKSELEIEFKDWYEGINNIPQPLSVLLCQRQNIVWDYKLRDVYSYLIATFILLNFIIGIVISTVIGETLMNYLLGLLLPSLSANILGIEEIVGHLNISKRKKELENKIISLINRMRTSLSNLSEKELRDIQDVIYSERLKAPLIPDFIYNRLKKKYSNNSIVSISDMMELYN